MPLTAEQLEELDAIEWATKAVSGPSFIHVCNWPGLYQGLVRRRLVTWGDPRPIYSKVRFRRVELTPRGHAVLAAHRASMKSRSAA